MKELQYHKIYLSWLGVAFTIFLGALYYSSNEGWDFLEGIYWATCTVTTVGYGDLAITYESTRAFGIFYLLAATSMFSVAVGNLLDVVYSPYDQDEVSPTISVTAIADQFFGKSNYIQPRSAPASSFLSKERLVLEVLMQVHDDSAPVVAKVNLLYALMA
jgi:hypothetical protein